MALTAVAIKNAKGREKPYKITDSEGLFLYVTPNGGRYWRMNWRARVFHRDDQLELALEVPDRELGPPPSRVAVAGRMNARGVSLFYGATEAAAAHAEVRPPEARREDRATLAEARRQHDDAAYGLERLLGTASALADQRRHLLWAVGSGLLAGMLLWSIMPGVILRALPASWHMPESMAAHIIGEPSLWNAGSRMMQAGSPEAWRAIADAAVMRHENKETIAACEGKAAKRKAPVRCTVNIGGSR